MYINRYSHDILDRIEKKELTGIKIVTNGIGKIIKKLIKERIITLTVMEEISSEGYTAGKRMFEMLYKEKVFKGHCDVSKSHIILYEKFRGLDKGYGGRNESDRIRYWWNSCKIWTFR